MPASTRKKVNSKNVFAIISIVIASLLLIFSFIGRFLSDGGFRQFCNFFVGSFGMSFYGIMIATILAGAFYLAGKRIEIPAKYVANWILMYITIVLLVHMFSIVGLNLFEQSFAQYSQYCYNYYMLPTFGGIVLGSIVYGLVNILTIWGASILLFAVLAINILVAVNFFYDLFSHKLILDKRVREVVESDGESSILPSPKTQEATLEEQARQEAISILFHSTSDAEGGVSPSGTYQDAPQSTIDILTPTTNQVIDTPTTQDAVQLNHFFGDDDIEEEDDNQFIVQSTNDEVAVVDNNNTVVDDGYFHPVETATVTPAVQSDQLDITQIVVEPIAEEAKPIDNTQYAKDNNLPVEEVSYTGDTGSDVVDQVNASEAFGNDKSYTIVRDQQPVNGGYQEVIRLEDTEELESKKKKVHRYPPYNRPPENILDDIEISVDDDGELRKQSADAIVKKLAVFGIKTEALAPIVGSSVTQYRLKVLSDKTRMGDFKNYADDLKSCLASKEDIRIEAPIPGTSYVGIEVANRKRRSVVLREVLESDVFKTYKGRLVFAIGQDINGRFVVADLAEMPHLLIAGSTGSGKSVVLNNLIISMMFKYSPEYLRFLMVDPKFVELSKYNGAPHLLTSEAITTVADALAGLDFLIAEMENRFVLFRDSHVSNISEYNMKVNPEYVQKLPYIVFVVDELADLMAASKKSVEAKIMRLAQKSRACGIHIVLATQRPSVDIVTGVIKANLPSRMALKVAAFADSKTILDGAGAEKLLGKGDMLFVNSGSPNAVRLQGAYVSNDEIYKLVTYIKEQNEVYFSDDIANTIFASRQIAEEESVTDTPTANSVERVDPYCKKALHFWLTRNNGKASIASLQRSIGVGFNRAGKIFDTLVDLGYVEPLAANEANTKPRMVLVTLEELDNLFPDQTIE